MEVFALGWTTILVTGLMEELVGFWTLICAFSLECLLKVNFPTF